MRKLLLFGMLTFLSKSYSQQSDALLWTGVGLKAKLSDKIGLKYESQVRFNQNASLFNNYYNEISGDYEWIDNFSSGISYRYSRRNRVNYFANDNRICINSDYSYKWKDIGLKFKARARYQFNFDRLNTINNTILPDQNHTFRLKISSKYKNSGFKRIQPSVYYELFKSLERESTSNHLVDAYRVSFGINFDLPKKQEITVKYIFEQENGTYPTYSHIYAIQYNYSFGSRLFGK